MSKKGKKNQNAGRRKFVTVMAVVLAALFLFWTVAGTVMVAHAEEAESISSNEMRGVWVSTVYGLDYPSEYTSDPQVLMADADRIIKNVREMGMNTVIFQVRPRC